jgi:hypothetical protein
MLQYIISLKVFRSKLLAAFQSSGQWASLTLPPSSQWIDLPFTPGSAKFTEKAVTSDDGVSYDSTLTFSRSGDSESDTNLMRNLELYGLVVLVAYNTGEIKVVGSPDYPAHLTVEQTTENNNVFLHNIVRSGVYRTPYLKI